MTFYVYQLVDPRDGLPFYVGKGQGRRAWEHQREVERGIVGKSSRKVDRIRQILMSGHDVEVQILADYDDEADAFDHEWRLVNSMPTLTNAIAGGSGGNTLTPAQVEKRKRIREARAAAEREKAAAATREAFLRRGVARYAGGKKTAHHADEVRDWLLANSGTVTPMAAPKKAKQPTAPTPKKNKPNRYQPKLLNYELLPDGTLKPAE